MRADARRRGPMRAECEPTPIIMRSAAPLACVTPTCVLCASSARRREPGEAPDVELEIPLCVYYAVRKDFCYPLLLWAAQEVDDFRSIPSVRTC